MRRHEDDYDYLFKIIVIGTEGSGKTAILQKYIDGTFDESYSATIGVDFKVKTLAVDKNVIKAIIWDTAGQERFRSITSHYYRGAHAIVVVHDLNDDESVEKLPYWFGEIAIHANDKTCTMLLGNKIDITQSDRAICRSRASDFAKEFNIPYFETSALTGYNIHSAFENLVRTIYDQNKLSCSRGDTDQPETSRSIVGGALINWKTRGGYGKKIKFGCCA